MSATIVTALRTLREQFGLSLEDAARTAGVAPSWLARVEAGTASMTHGMAGKLTRGMIDHQEALHSTPDRLGAHLALLDERAHLALAVLEGDDAMALLESLGIEDTDETGEQVAEDYLHSGYAFTPSPGTATVVVLAAGGPEIHLARHGDGYALTGYMPGHRDAVRTSPAIDAWGRLRDTEHTAREPYAARSGPGSMPGHL